MAEGRFAYMCSFLRFYNIISFQLYFINHLFQLLKEITPGQMLNLSGKGMNNSFPDHQKQ